PPHSWGTKPTIKCFSTTIARSRRKRMVRRISVFFLRERKGAGHDVPPPDEGFAPQPEPSRARPVTTAPGRTLPASIEAEEHLISAIFIDPASVLQRCEEARITADSFSDPKHGIVFDCQRATFQRLGYTDVAIVAEELKASRQLDQVNGYAFLVQVSSRSPTTAQASYFVDKVREQATLREIIKTATSAVEDCYNFSGEIDELLDGVERRIASVKAGSSISSKWALRSFADFTTPPDDDANALLGRYRYLCRGGALVISGATGIGKSSIAFQSAVHWALGRDFLGIPCTRPLKALIIGAEDDEGDIGEVRDSIFAAMKLTAAEVAAVKTRVIVVDERAAV